MRYIFKLQPAIFILSKHAIGFYKIPAETLQCIFQ